MKSSHQGRTGEEAGPTYFPAAALVERRVCLGGDRLEAWVGTQETEAVVAKSRQSAGPSFSWALTQEAAAAFSHTGSVKTLI